MPLTLKPEEAPSDATSVTHVEGFHGDDYSTAMMMSDKPKSVVPKEIHSDLNACADHAATVTPSSRTKQQSSSKKKSKKTKTPKQTQKSSENLRRSFQEEFPTYFELEHFMDGLEESKAFSVQMDGSVVRSASLSTTSTNGSRGEKLSSSRKGNDPPPTTKNVKDVEMGVVDSALVPQKVVDDIAVTRTADEPRTTQKSQCQSMTKREVLCWMLFGVIIVAAAVTLPILLIKGDKTQDGVKRLDAYDDSYVISPLPIDLCHKGYGEARGNSSSCSNAAEPGLLCDIVANSFINVTGADLALLNIGVCKESITGPQLTVGDIRAALQIQPLVLVEISGRNLQQVLEQAMTTTFGLGRYENNKLAYPYAAGLRYDVAANLDEGSRITQVEVNVEHLGLWRPINPRRFYKVVTTIEIANGGYGYREFSQINDHWITRLPFTAGDALLDYAVKHRDTWWNLDADSYSTHSFVGPEIDPTIATVPESICLEWASDPEDTINICSQSDTLRRRGGGSCGLVAWGLLDQFLFADVALIQASLCARDIPSGNFIDRHVETLVPLDEELVMVRMNGTSILQLLNNALEYAIEQSVPGAYPYAAALRYTVDTTATGSANRIISAETMTPSKRWIPLVESDLFSVITTRDLAEGHQTGYQGFGNVNASSTGYRTRQAILDYVTEWKTLYVPPIDMFSIQGFIS